MLSRASLLSAQRPLITSLIARTSASAATPPADSLYQRPVRKELPDKVRLGFVPEEWFTFFYKKTGVTGPYMFGISLATYLCSKEIYVMEHEYYSGLSILVMAVFAIKKFGPMVAAALDKEIDKFEAEANEGRNQELASYEDSIKEEELEQWRAEGQMLLIEAKKENVALQLEAEYRERLARVYNEVKRRLDYQVELLNVERRINQKHLVNWVVNGVLKSITPEQEKETLNKCILDLGTLAATVAPK